MGTCPFISRLPNPLSGAIAALLLASGCATSWPVHPGDAVSLEDDQGLLVVHVSTNVPLHIVKIGSIRAAEDVPAGDHLRLIGATRGSYRWSDLEVAGGQFWFRNVAELRFRIEPGVINYVGMIKVRRNGPYEIYMDSIDRSAMALEELRRIHPELATRFPIVYSGGARHVFLEHLANAEARGDSESGE